MDTVVFKACTLMTITQSKVLHFYICKNDSCAQQLAVVFIMTKIPTKYLLSMEK